MDTEIQGFCDGRFSPLRDAFAANFADGLELGSSLAVTWRGKPVVDLWGGFADLNRTKPWQKNTIVLVYSTGKIATVMCILMLADRGRIDLDSPIARYWRAFGQNGKENVTVRDFLTHQGGVPGFNPPVTEIKELFNWRAITARIAAQPHRFGGKKVICYHPVTYGFVLGEIIRRIDGRMPSKFFRQEIARKAGIDFHLGLSRWRDARRVAEMQMPSTPPPFEGNETAAEILASYPPMLPSRDWKFLSAVSPASNAYANGRSIARLCAVVANRGRLGWRRYLSERMVAQAGEEQVAGEDLYIGKIRWGLGFGLDSDIWPAPSPTSLHWGGAGGSWGLMDPGSRVSLGFAPSNFINDPSALQDPRVKRFDEALARIIQTLPR